MTKFRYNGKDKAFAKRFAGGGLTAANGYGLTASDLSPGALAAKWDDVENAKAEHKKGKMTPQETMEAGELMAHSNNSQGA